jgi:Amt family ammonium transporter
MRFGSWMVFAGLWAVAVYFPVAHWVFAFDNDTDRGGWIANQLAAVDFAGGTAVHINAGAAALAVAIVLGRRATFGQSPRPHNVPLTLLGAGLLWAGWYAFNGGSALTAGHSASVVMLTTFTATCSAMLAWLAVEKLKYGHSSAVGAASGAIAGLVAITPACGAVTPVGAILLGAIAGAVCPLALGLKDRFGYDDSLDVVGVHLVGGLLGTVLIGLLGTADMPSGQDGLFYGGGVHLLWVQTVAAVAVLVYSFVVTMLLATALRATIGLRVSPEHEEGGLDRVMHRDPAYDLV